ncbi:hypothetical protein, partial [Escherichia coli]
LQGKISSDGCLKKEQMVVSAIASTPHGVAGNGKVISSDDNVLSLRKGKSSREVRRSSASIMRTGGKADRYG